MKYDYHLIVIGAGSGGLVVASGAAGLGAKVALIEEDKMGGDCLNTGCIPSKSFLKGAHLASELAKSKDYGINSRIDSIDFKKFMNRISTVIKSIEPHDSVERYENLGVDVFKGIGSFIDKNTILINNNKITAKNIVIATGSTAYIPPIEGLNKTPFLTNSNIFNLETLPNHLIILGAGPIGMELGQGFRHLGADVTIIDRIDSLFPKDDKEVGPIMEKQFIEENISLKLSSSIIRIKHEDNLIKVTISKNGNEEIITGDKILVSLGRSPVTKKLKLENVNVKTNERGYIQTNNKLQTNINNIYACGDVVGPFQFTHMASYQASIVIQNIIFPIKKSINYYNIPWTTYTKPEVAHVGLTEDMAIGKNMFSKFYLIPLEDNDRAKTDNDKVGFLKIILNNKSVIIGATLVGDKAGEQIALVNLAITKKMKLNVFMSMIFPYPTESEIFKSIALLSLKDSFKPWQQNLIKKLFLK